MKKYIVILLSVLSLNSYANNVKPVTVEDFNNYEFINLLDMASVARPEQATKIYLITNMLTKEQQYHLDSLSFSFTGKSYQEFVCSNKK